MYLKYLVPRKKGIVIRLAFITLTLSSLMIGWWLSRVTSRALLPPLPDQRLEHFRLNRNLKTYLDSIDLLIEPSAEVCTEKIPILVIVTSSPNRFEHRHAIRSTWAKHLPTLFIMGVDGDLEDLKVENYIETKQYRDIIMYNFRDHYQNLTIKSALMLKWTQDHCPPEMLFKTDDDVLVNPRMMERLVVEAAGKDLVGYKKIDNYPHRDQYNKWYLPQWLYRQDSIPEYLSGTGYLINGKHIGKILEAAYKVPMINLEDVYFTYLVARLNLSLKLSHDPRLSPYKPWLPINCVYSGLVSAHSFSPKELVSSWKYLEELNEDDCEFLNDMWSEWFLY